MHISAYHTNSKLESFLETQNRDEQLTIRIKDLPIAGIEGPHSESSIKGSRSLYPPLHMHCLNPSSLKMEPEDSHYK